MSTIPDPNPSLPVAGVYQGRQTTAALLRQLLMALAPSASLDASSLALARQVWLIDRRFDDWPLDDAAVQSALGAWLRQGGRSLHLLGVDFDATSRALPRFSRWRRDWMHAIEVHRPVEGLLPSALRGLLAPPVLLQWLDAPDWRLRVFTDSVQVREAQTEIADFLQQCEPAWPSTTLGL